MVLSAPSKPLFMLALILAIAAILSTFVVIPMVTANAFTFMAIAFIVLCAGVLFRGT